MVLTCPLGLIVIVNVVGTPGHELAPIGVTVMVPVMGAVPLFVPVKLIALVVPVAASPIAGLLFVHE